MAETRCLFLQGTGVNVDPVVPSIFARAVLPRMGVDMPRVGTGGYSTMTITAAVPPIYLIRGASRTPTGPPALVMAPSSL